MINRPFNVDLYLSGKPQPEPLDLRFRRCAIRLNEWAERKLDQVDWRELDIKAGTFCGYALTGVAVYLGFKVADAILAGLLR